MCLLEIWSPRPISATLLAMRRRKSAMSKLPFPAGTTVCRPLIASMLYMPNSRTSAPFANFPPQMARHRHHNNRQSDHSLHSLVRCPLLLLCQVMLLRLLSVPKMLRQLLWLLRSPKQPQTQVPRRAVYSSPPRLSATGAHAAPIPPTSSAASRGTTVCLLRYAQKSRFPTANAQLGRCRFSKGYA